MLFPVLFPAASFTSASPMMHQCLFHGQCLYPYRKGPAYHAVPQPFCMLYAACSTRHCTLHFPVCVDILSLMLSMSTHLLQAWGCCRCCLSSARCNKRLLCAGHREVARARVDGDQLCNLLLVQNPSRLLLLQGMSLGSGLAASIACILVCVERRQHVGGNTLDARRSTP